MTEPKISVVIPVKNGEMHLPNCLNSLRELDYPSELLEVVIADGGSTDRSREIAKEFGVRVIDNPKQRVAPGRNVGFAASHGDLIAFTDDDCTFEPGWLRNAVKYFDDPSVSGIPVGGIGGPTKIPPDETHFGRAVAVFFRLGVWLAGSVQNDTIEKVREVDDIPGGNAVYRRQVLETVMPTYEGLLTADDVELNFQVRQAGYRLLSVPDVVVWHYKRQSPRSFWRQMYRFAIGRVQVGKRHPSLWRAGHWLAGLALPCGVAGLALAAALNLWFWLGLAMALPTVGLVAMAWWSSRSGMVALNTPLVLALGVLGWSTGFLREWIKPYRGEDLGR